MAGLLLIVPHTVFVANPTVLNMHLCTYPNGAFPSIHHNDIRDVIAELLSKTCHDVSTKPSLQLLSGESLSLASANTESNWSNPYRQHEATKHHQYKEHVREIKHGSFSPLVFSVSGGTYESIYCVVYKCLAFLLSTEWKTLYSDVICWLHCYLGFFPFALFHYVHPWLLFLLWSPFQGLCTTFC